MGVRRSAHSLDREIHHSVADRMDYLFLCLLCSSLSDPLWYHLFHARRTSDGGIFLHPRPNEYSVRYRVHSFPSCQSDVHHQGIVHHPPRRLCVHVSWRVDENVPALCRRIYPQPPCRGRDHHVDHGVSVSSSVILHPRAGRHLPLRFNILRTIPLPVGCNRRCSCCSDCAHSRPDDHASMGPISRTRHCENAVCTNPGRETVVVSSCCYSFVKRVSWPTADRFFSASSHYDNA